jgi:hypothetical protein
MTVTLKIEHTGGPELTVLRGSFDSMTPEVLGTINAGETRQFTTWKGQALAMVETQDLTPDILDPEANQGATQ